MTLIDGYPDDINNCQSAGGPPCGRCPECKQVEREDFDLWEQEIAGV